MSEGIHQQAGDDAIQIGQARDVYIGNHRLRPGVPFQAPPLPSHFVPRPEVSDALKACLLADEAAAPGVLVVSAIYGLGGIGKSTLAAALAYDEDVQKCFSDGILWVTLGHEPDLLSLLSNWIINALHDYNYKPITVEAASIHMRTLLHDKSCLLVVDDAWQTDHVRPFLVSGPRCRVLITTRNAALARKVNARLYDLDVMSEAQALALFEKRLGPLEDDREQAIALARELGHLPLALELAAAQVGAGCSWAELLNAFCKAQADLAALDVDEASHRNESLRLSFRLSLERLSADDQDAFAWLGVLPEGVCLNPAMAATLWDEPEVDAHRRLRRLRDRALLKLAGDDRYTLHQLLHDEAKLRLVERMPLPRAHAAFLERYRQEVPYEQWHCLPEDDYIHGYLTWHMEQAGWEDEFHCLLQMETRQRRNAWYEALERLGQATSFLDDVARAWRWSESKEGWDVGRQVRCALIESSIRSLSDKISPALLFQLVETKMWSPKVAFARVLQMPDELRQAEAITKLAPFLSDALMREALTAVWGMRNEIARVFALSGLVGHLPEELEADALALTRGIEHQKAHALALGELKGYLTGDLGVEASAMVQGIANDRARAQAASGLTGYLLADLRNEASVKRGRADTSAKVLKGLASHPPDQLKAEVLKELAEVQRVADEEERALALSKLASRLPDRLKVEAAREALKVVQKITGEMTCAKTLISVVEGLPDELKAEMGREAWAVTQEILSEPAHAIAMSGCVGHLSDDMKAREMKETLAAVQRIRHDMERIRALRRLAEHLTDKSKSEVFREEFKTQREIPGESIRAFRLSMLVEHLPEDLKAGAVDEILVAVQGIDDRKARARALRRLVGRLTGKLKVKVARAALTATGEIPREEARAFALSELASHLPSELKAEALAMARGIHSKSARAQALSGLATHLPDELKYEVGREALAAARGIATKDARARALSRLVGHLPDELKYEVGREALAAARGIATKDARARALSKLASYLPDESKAEVLWAALAAAIEVEKPKKRTSLCAQIASSWEKAACSDLRNVQGLWHQKLHVLARHRRSELIDDLTALLPLIAFLGGMKAVAETFRAIQDVGRWWP